MRDKKWKIEKHTCERYGDFLIWYVFFGLEVGGYASP
jgi:hypothetical protein